MSNEMYKSTFKVYVCLRIIDVYHDVFRHSVAIVIQYRLSVGDIFVEMTGRIDSQAANLICS